jgi:hypothetical protein
VARLLYTTKADVKARTGYTDTDKDAVIDDLIAEVSREAEDFMGREGLLVARTETHKLQPNRTYVSVNAFPITTVASVKYALSEDFSAVTALDAATYSVLKDLGQIRLLVGAIGAQYNPGFVEVQYTGGLAVDAAGLKTAEPRLAGAVCTEVVNRLNRAKNPEGNVVGFGNGVAYQGAMKPLDDFYTALGHRRRLRL